MALTESKPSNDTCGIEKYEGSFDQDDLGVTQIPTETILTIKNLTLLGFYTYLASRPKDWKLNAKHLAGHFDCNKEKIYKAIDALIAMGFLKRTRIRNKGMFVRYHYRLHLRQIVQVAPCPEKPDTVKPDTENPDTYKTENKQSKENITTTTCSSLFNPFETKCLEFKHSTDERTPDEFLENVHHHVKFNSDPDSGEYQRQQMILKLLRNLHQNAAIFKSKGYVSKETIKETEKQTQEQKDKLLWSAYQGYVKSPIEQKLRDEGQARLESFEEWKLKQCTK